MNAVGCPIFNASGSAGGECAIDSARQRRALAQERLPEAWAALRQCRLCAHDCGVNRFAGERGVCAAAPQARIFSAQLEVGDELELIPTFAIALSGCDLRCDFCITGESSWNPRAGVPLGPDLLARWADFAEHNRVRSVMILGGEPTIHLPSALQIAAAMPETVRLVWKTNGHCSALARQFLEGIFDVWVVDYKFGNDECAERLAKIQNYSVIVQENLLWAKEHGELIVRHLLMPGHLDCCWRPVAEWLAAELPGVKVSLHGGFWPAWRSAHHFELQRPGPRENNQQAADLARQLGLNLVP